MLAPTQRGQQWVFAIALNPDDWFTIERTERILRASDCSFSIAKMGTHFTVKAAHAPLR
jgi:hypothetical protein